MSDNIEVRIKRPRYFPGQYLLAEDFQLEQEYHMDRRRCQNRLLHVSGIAEGLQVKSQGGNTLVVTAGKAIDSAGRLIVQPSPKILKLKEGNGEETKNLEPGPYTVSIRYGEEPVNSQHPPGTPHSNTRWQETPKITLEQGAGEGDAVRLAAVTVDPPCVFNQKIDNDVRKYSGIRLPRGPQRGAVVGEGPTLRATEAGQVELNGHLCILGNVGIGNIVPNTMISIEIPKEKETLNGLSIKIDPRSKGCPFDVTLTDGSQLFTLDVRGNLTVGNHHKGYRNNGSGTLRATIVQAMQAGSIIPQHKWSELEKSPGGHDYYIEYLAYNPMMLSKPDYFKDSMGVVHLRGQYVIDVGPTETKDFQIAKIGKEDCRPDQMVVINTAVSFVSIDQALINMSLARITINIDGTIVTYVNNLEGNKRFMMSLDGINFWNEPTTQK